MTDFPCCVTGATQDPRIPAVTRALHDDSVPGCPMVDCEVGHAYYAKVAAVAIAAADAADAAAGIRRVPTVEPSECHDTGAGVCDWCKSRPVCPYAPVGTARRGSAS